MVKRIVLLLGVLALARAQIPSLGFCPDYVPMVNFDMSRFIGPWYEAERYFQLTEVASRCVMSNYTKGNDAKYRVSNEITSRFTGIRRILDGEIRIPENKRDEGKIVVRYTSVPLITPETTYSILETDYDSYAVMWSCAGVGPVHTQNAWIMTRKRLAPGETLQKAYAVLDKYKISKTFFVKTDQDDCAFLELPRPYRGQKPEDQADEDLAEDEPVRGAQEEPVRDHIITPDAPEIIKMQTRNVVQPSPVQQQQQQEVVAAPAVSKSAEPVPVENVAQTLPIEAVKSAEPAPVENLAPVVVVEEAKTVPETILKIAEEHQAPATDIPLEKMAAVVEELPKEEPVVKVEETPVAVPDTEIVPPVVLKEALPQQDQPVVQPEPVVQQHQEVVHQEPIVKVVEEIKQVPV